jgi:hypothetical protein
MRRRFGSAKLGTVHANTSFRGMKLVFGVIDPAAQLRQGVSGEGPLRPRIMLVGEQPGDEEDRQGHPFVGPAASV